MSLEVINQAILKGAKLYPNISGGKDGQAMVKVMLNNKIPMAALIHADLGRVEWTESAGMCVKSSIEAKTPLQIIKRADGRDMIDQWKARLEKLKSTGKPFWSSSQSRYCTSDMKRDPIDKFYRNCGNDFIISCEGIRAGESTQREKKTPLTIRTRISHKMYLGMTVEQAIAAFTPGKRLALTWYPIFHYSKEDVWNSYGMSTHKLLQAQAQYAVTNKVPDWWQFHPAYVYGNERVSCVFCVLGCGNDLTVGAQHRPELLNIMIDMENEGKATFKMNYTLKQLK